VAAPGLVVTNAHVVAGETDPTIQIGGNPPGLPVQVVDFDPHDDIAVLRAPGLNARPLPLVGSPAHGTPAGIVGYPLDGPLDIQPGRIAQAETATTQDAYGNGPVRRSILPLRGLVRPGNSGGPLVDAGGGVLGTVFAALSGSSSSSAGDGLAVPNDLVRAQLARAESRRSPVSSGPCAG
jgi:S1-C subfamily serine protease